VATPVSSNPLVVQHYAAVVDLNEDLVEALRSLEQPEDLDLPPEYLALVVALVNHYSLAAIGESADYYEAMRELADVLAPFRTPVVDPPADAVVAAAILAALSQADLAPGEADIDIAAQVQNLIEGITQTLVMEAGRDEVWTAIENDVAAKGWARVTRPGACAFCRMLATRGPVYKTERSASFQAHTAGPHGGGDCQCGVEPLFATKYEFPVHVQADRVLWSETGSLNEFRRAVEGRSDGPRRRQRTRAGR
jgi:hypothetical protein